MKNLYLLTIGVVFLLFASCDKIKEATTVEIDTDLTVDIPITTTTGSGLTKSGGAAVYAYAGNATFSLANNEDIKKYISNIDNIIANGVAVVTIKNVPAGGTVNSCLVKYGLAPTAGITALNLTSPMTASGGVITITDVAWVNNVINALKQNVSGSYKFDISGSADFSVNSTFSIKIPVTVEASPL